MTRPRGGPTRWLHTLGLGRPEPDESVTMEIEHHLAETVDRLIAEGWDAGEARREADRRFGDAARYGPEMLRSERRRLTMARWAGVWDVIRQSLLSVVRTARRYPGFTVAVVVTLGLGIGANATMYGIIDRLLIRPPAHVEDPGQVRRVFIERPSQITGGTSIGSTLTYPDYVDLEAHGGLASVAAYTPPSMPGSERTIGSGADAARARTSLASASFFPLLGVSPTIGRFFGPEDAVPGSPPTAVLGGTYWRRAYGSDRAVIGRTIEISGRTHTIIGVAPADFTGVDLAPVDIWLPLELTRAADDGDDDCLESRGCSWMRAVVRLEENVSIPAAEAEATSLHLAGRSEEIRRERYPYSDRARIVFGSLIGDRGPSASDESRVARWLTGVSLIVLLIACANVANLLMARGVRARREIGVRLALGAARRRVVAQTIAETVLLALGGGALAVAIARWGGEVVRSALLPNVYFPDSGVTLRLLLFTLAAALMAGVLAGIAPALQGSRVELARGLADGTRGSTAARSRVRDFLSASQAALSVVLLVGAGLFVRSLHEVSRLDLGLDVDQVLLARLEFRDSDLEPNRQSELYEEAIQRVSSLPDVSSAAATGVPFRSGYAGGFRVPGLDSIPMLPGGGPYEYPVGARYFATLGLAITQGRGIGATDIADGNRVVVVSETMARTLWPQGDALGQCVTYGDVDSCATVVGVAEDAARYGFQDAPFMAVYYPASETTRPLSAMYIRGEGRAEAVVADVVPVLRSFSSEIRFADVRMLRDILDPQARSWTLGATMFSVFGLLALVLAAIGLYSVLAFDVAQRTRELGIRTALGAERARLLRSVLLQGARLGAVGVVVGLAIAYVAAPYTQDLLFQVSPREPGLLAGVAIVLLAVSVAASLVPGLRATRVDPLTALRAE